MITYLILAVMAVKQIGGLRNTTEHVNHTYKRQPILFFDKRQPILVL